MTDEQIFELADCYGVEFSTYYEFGFPQLVDFARALLQAASAAPAQEPTKYGCHCDLEPHKKPDDCVIDNNRRNDCVYARRYETKEQCVYWKPIDATPPQLNKGEV